MIFVLSTSLFQQIADSIKNAPSPKALKSCLNRFLALEAFEIDGEFLSDNWGAILKTDPVVDSTE